MSRQSKERERQKRELKRAKRKAELADPVEVKEEPNRKPAHEQAARKCRDDAVGEISVADRGKSWRSLEIAGDLILGLLAGVFGSTGHPVVAVILGYFSLCIALSLLSQSIIDRWGKGKLIWSLCGVAAGFCLISGALWIDSIVRNEEQQALSGVLLPANDPTPPNSLPAFLTNAMFLRLGAAWSWATTFPHTAIQFGEKKVLTISTNRGGITISAEFFGRNGNIVAAIADNKFLINQFNYFTRERPDRSTLIVRDQENVEVLNIRFMNRRCLRLLGRIRLPGRPDIVMATNETTIGGVVFHEGSLGGHGVDIFIP